eukprot:310496-Chlamydomonas_euryale.AAC.3
MRRGRKGRGGRRGGRMGGVAGLKIVGLLLEGRQGEGKFPGLKRRQLQAASAATPVIVKCPTTCRGAGARGCSLNTLPRDVKDVRRKTRGIRRASDHGALQDRRKLPAGPG